MLHWIPFFHGLWFVWLFLCISRQIFDQTYLKFGGQIYQSVPLAWLTACHALLNPRCFLTSDSSSNFHAFSDKHWSDPAYIWWVNSLWATPSFWSRSTEFLSFPVPSDMLSSFHAFTEKPADQIMLNFGGQTHFGPLLAWLTFGYAISMPQLGWAVSTHYQTNCWLDLV